MKAKSFRKLGVLMLFLAAVAGGAGVVWRVAYFQALDQVAQRGKADLALAVDRLGGQLQRYREMAVLMADHPVLTALVAGGDDGAARALLVGAAENIGA